MDATLSQAARLERRRRRASVLLQVGFFISLAAAFCLVTPLILLVIAVYGWISAISLGMMCAAAPRWRALFSGAGCVCFGATWGFWLTLLGDFIEFHIGVAKLNAYAIAHAMVYIILLLPIAVSPFGALLLLAAVGAVALIEMGSTPPTFDIPEVLYAAYLMQFATGAAFGLEIFLRLQRDRPRPGFCPSCGYDIRAIGGERCPECGLEIAARAG